MTDTVELLGTYHNSDESIQQVEDAIREKEPDVVAIELPPRAFTDEFDWSVSEALDPRNSVTLPAVALQRLILGEGLWQVDEMFVAAHTAVDIGADVALIDRPYVESIDKMARMLVRDAVNDLQALRREFSNHREQFADDRPAELVTRDVWRVGELATPFVEYAWHLFRHGATNPLDASQREQAAKRMGPEGSAAGIDRTRLYFPQMMATHIDERDACMAGHLRWLTNEVDDVLGVVAMGHVSGIMKRLNGQQELDTDKIQQPTFADPDDIPVEPIME